MKKFFASILCVVMLFTLVMSACSTKSVPIEGINLDKSSLTLDANAVYSLKAALVPENTTQKQLKYSTSNESVVTVDSKGEITAVNAGTAVITVTSTENGSISASCNVEVTAVLGDMSKKLDITWMIAGDASAYVEGSDIEKMLEEKFNVNLTTIPVNSSDNEKFNVTIASGVIPDVLVRWDHQKLYSDGIVRSFPVEWVETYMPQSYKTMNELGGKLAWEYVKGYEDGQNFAIPQISAYGAAKLVLAVRKDWLDNVGITKVPATIDEIYAAAKAFTFNDPDKNGEKDTYGFGGAGMHPNPLFWQFQSIFGAYGVHPQYWIEDNGKVVYGAVADGYKEALKLLKSWYKEGIIDPEFVTDQNATYSNKVSTGVLGFYDGHPTYFDYNNQNSVSYLIKQKDPNGEFVFTKPVTGPEGKSGAASYGVVATWPQMFGVKTSDEKVIRAMQISEELNNDVDLFKKTFFGELGVDYDQNGDMCTNRADIVQAAKGIKIYRTGSYLYKDIYKTFLSEVAISMMVPTYTDKLIASVIDANRLTTLNKSSISQADMDKVVKEFYFNAITGKVDIDSEWDGYVKTWMDLGGKVLTEEAQKAPRMDK